MRTIWNVALLSACFIWTIHAQGQSSQNNSNQGSNNHGNSINNIDSNHNNRQQQLNQQQSQPKENILDEPIRFNTKAKDACSMVVLGQGNFTKLRVSCKSKGKSYWCDFLGKPNLCKAYNNNPRHYFNQIMWDMRKLQNACQGPRVYKPQMCRSASDEAQIVFHASWPKTLTSKPTQAPQDRNQNQHKQQQPIKSSNTTKPPTHKQQLKPQQPAKTATKPVKPAVSKPVQPRKPVKITTARPTVAEENHATQLAEEYCWKSLQGVCAYVISWFQNE